METKDISKNELREIMKEAVAAVLTERRDLLENAVSEAILDMKLGLAMEEADTGEYVSEESVLDKLKAWWMKLRYTKTFSKDLDEEYFRLRVGDYRLGMKKTKEGVEMLRLLHRKDIYKKFPWYFSSANYTPAQKLQASGWENTPAPLTRRVGKFSVCCSPSKQKFLTLCPSCLCGSIHLPPSSP